MFTSVKLKNFRSFKEISFNLCDKPDSPKHMAIVYGENGAGKSNLASVFVLLNELMQTMDIRDQYEEMLAAVTLTGIGGIGKTSLAVWAANEAYSKQVVANSPFFV